MVARYGHFTLDELRGAVETISSPQRTFLRIANCEKNIAGLKMEKSGK
jgi:hypothetical protein